MSAGPSTKALIDGLIQSAKATNAEAAIRQKAQQALDRYQGVFGEPAPGFNIAALASLLGIAISPEAPSHSKDAELAPIDGRRVAIRVNSERPETRQRFSIGHEISHTFFPNYQAKAKTWCRTDARHRRRDNPDEYLEMLCDIGSAALLMPNRVFDDLAARVTAAAGLLALAQTFVVSPEAMLRRFAERHSGTAAAVYLSWKLKPIQQRTIGLANQARLFGSQEEEAKRAKKLRVDYSIPSASFDATGCFIPGEKSVESSGPIYDAASSGLPCEGVCSLDFGSGAARYHVMALPVWTAEPDLGPAGENGVAALIEIVDQSPRRAKAKSGPGFFD